MKRRWNWKEKHVRKHRFKEDWHTRFERYKMDKFYKKYLHRQNRARRILGKEELKKVSSLNWMYW